MATPADKKSAGQAYVVAAAALASASTALGNALDDGDVVYAPSNQALPAFQKSGGKVVPVQVINLEQP